MSVNIVLAVNDNNVLVVIKRFCIAVCHTYERLKKEESTDACSLRYLYFFPVYGLTFSVKLRRDKGGRFFRYAYLENIRKDLL